MQVKDKLLGVRRLGFEEKQALPNHDFRGKECYELTLEGLGTVILPLDGVEIHDVCMGVAQEAQIEITLSILSKADA